MATPFSKPLEYAEYIEPVDMDLLLKAVTYKQGKHDLNKQRITNLVNQAIDMPFAKDQDREYFDARMSSLVNALNRFGAGDLSSDSRADYLVGYLAQASDDLVANGVEGALWKKQYDQSALDAREKNPESYSEINYDFGLINYETWLNDGQIGSDVNSYSNPWIGKGVGTYQPFVNPDVLIREELDKIDPEITFEITPFGNGIQYYKNKYEIITDDKILNSINLQVEGNPALQKQLEINAWATYGSLSSDQLAPQLQSYYQDKLDQTTKSIEFYRKKKGGASAEELVQINNAIKELKKNEALYEEKSSIESVNNTLANPNQRVATLKQLYNEDLYSNYMFQYATQNLVDMSVIVDEAAKINATASANRALQSDGEINDILKEMYLLQGKGETGQAESMAKFLTDVYGYSPGTLPDGTPATASDLLSFYRAGTTSNILKDESILGEDGEILSLADKFEAEKEILRDQASSTIVNIAGIVTEYNEGSPFYYGGTAAEVKATIGSWDEEQIAAEITKASTDGKYEELYNALTSYKKIYDTYTDYGEVTSVALDRFYISIEDDLINQKNVELSPYYTGSGQFLYVDNGALKMDDNVSAYEINNAFDGFMRAKKDQYERESGPVGAWFRYKGRQLRNVLGNTSSFLHDRSAGRANTDGWIVNSYKQNVLATTPNPESFAGLGFSLPESIFGEVGKSNLQRLYDYEKRTDPTGTMPLYTSIAGFRGYDVDGDGNIDYDEQTGQPIIGSPQQAVYGEGIVEKSRLPMGQRIAQGLPKTINNLFMFMPVGQVVGRGARAARMAQVPTQVANRSPIANILGQAPVIRPVMSFVGRRFPRVASVVTPNLPKLFSRGMVAGKNYRRGQYTPALPGAGNVVGRASRNIPKGSYIPYTGGMRYFAPSALQLGLGQGLSIASSLLPAYLAGDMNYNQMVNTAVLTDALDGSTESYKKAIAEIINSNYYSSRDGQFFPNASAVLGDKYRYVLSDLLLQNNYQKLATRSLNLSEDPAGFNYAQEIFSMMGNSPNSESILSTFPALQSYESYKANIEDPDPENGPINLTVKNIGAGEVMLQITQGDEQMMAQIPMDKNSRFYNEIVMPEIIAYNREEEILTSNLANFIKARKQVVDSGGNSSGYTRSLSSLTAKDPNSNLFMRPVFKMQYQPHNVNGLDYVTRQNNFEGTKRLHLTGVEIVDGNGNVLGVVERITDPNDPTKEINFNQSQMSSTNEQDAEILFGNADQDIADAQARRLLTNEALVQGIMDKFNESK